MSDYSRRSVKKVTAIPQKMICGREECHCRRFSEPLEEEAGNGGIAVFTVDADREQDFADSGGGSGVFRGSGEGDFPEIIPEFSLIQKGDIVQFFRFSVELLHC